MRLMGEGSGFSAVLGGSDRRLVHAGVDGHNCMRRERIGDWNRNACHCLALLVFSRMAFPELAFPEWLFQN